MSRYDSTKIKKTEEEKFGKRMKSLSYTTTIYNDTPEKDDDIYVTTQVGDRLDNLALTFYGSPEFWWFIANVNNLTTMNVEAGLTLRIPSSLSDAKGK
tara:strand:+ start:18081 stop:18374 length:294 start_codon:yes stop_codon:yes gene_type:complete